MTFKSDGVWGSLLFLSAYNDLWVESARKPAAVCKWLGITPRTLDAWLTGRRCPPNSAVIALWYESGRGLQVLDYDAMRQINTYRGLSDSLRRANDELRSDKARLLAENAELKRTHAEPRRFAANDSFS